MNSKEEPKKGATKKTTNETVKPKKLALVVHGIGEQHAGDTLDALVGGLTGDKTCTVSSDIRQLKAKDHDLKDGDEDRKGLVFPAHTRRVKTDTHEVVFAEVFWGDLSRGSSGRIGTLLLLFQVVMGLGHIVRENAESIHKKNHPLAKLANAFVHILQGPITVLNIVFGLGVFALAGLEFSLSQWKWLHPVIPSLAVLLVCFLLRLQYKIIWKPTHSVLFQIYWRWTLWFSRALFAFVIVTWVAIIVLPDSVDQALFKAFQLPKEVTDACTSILVCTDYWYAGVLILGIAFLWMVSVLIVAILGFGQWRYDRTAQDKNGENQKLAEKTLYPATCAAMLVIWMFAAIVLWVSSAATLGKTIDANWSVLDNNLTVGIALSYWIWIAFICLIVASTITWIKRGKFGKKYTAETVKDNKIDRLIVNHKIRIGLTISMAFLLAGILFEGYRLIANTFPFITDFPHSDTEASIFKISTLAAGGVALAYGIIWDKLAVGLGIAKDIVVYFVKRIDVNDPAGFEYPIRKAIQERFSLVYTNLVNAENPQEVVVISHSQGTFVSLEALREGRLRDQAQDMLIKDRAYIEPDLITMGSPTEHLYSFYFGPDFVIDETALDGTKSWTNIYRIDDFVGTTVEGETPGLVVNKAVNAGGHTGYWNDDQVLPKIIKTVFENEFGKA